MKMWCKTQAVVVLSSAEAELKSLVRASSETMVLISMYKDLGTRNEWIWSWEMQAQLSPLWPTRVDKLRHLDTIYVWTPEKNSKERPELQESGWC